MSLFKLISYEIEASIIYIVGSQNSEYPNFKMDNLERVKLGMIMLG